MIKINHKGNSLLEVIVAMAIFSLISTTMAYMALGGNTSLEQGGEQTQAQALAEQAIEAVKSIRNRAYNEIVFRTSTVATSSGQWFFSGENTTSTIGQYERSISFLDVCRDTSDDISDCPGSYTDINTKLVSVTVSWPIRPGVYNSVNQQAYITNWDSVDWTQTDWFLGSGQNIWSDSTMYDTDDNNIDYSTAGEIKLMYTASSGGCGVKSWPFTVSSSYIYNSSDIEVTNGLSQLKAVFPSGWWSTSYSYRTPIIINTGSNGPYKGYNGYTTRSIINSQSLITAGKIQNDCDDIRVVYDNGTPVELDRQIIDCNTASTEIIFKLQANISDSSSDNNYYIYYGNSSVTAGPQNMNNIFLWYDDATTDRSASYTFGRCDAWHGSGYSAWSYDAVNDYYFVDTGNDYTGCFRHPTNERDAYIEAEMYHSGCYPTNMSSGVFGRYILASGSGATESASHYYASNRAEQSACGGGYSDDGDICEGSRCSLGINGTNPSAISTNQWRKQGLAINGINNTNLNFWDSDTTAGYGSLGFPSVTANASGNDSSDQEGSGDWGIITAQDNVRVRNILIRRYTSPEPSIIVGSEQSAGSYSSLGPSINPLNTHSVTGIGLWTSFNETAVKNGGEVYYQLSDDGTNWYYWSGSAWVSAGGSNYNTAIEINTNISSFSTTTAQISFKAFLDGDGTQQVQLDEVQISCEQYYNWPFNVSSSYSYDTAKLEVSGGFASLTTSGGGDIDGITKSSVDSLEFDSNSGYDHNMIHINGDIYASAYRGPGNDGWIKTFQITDSGVIGNSAIDSLEFDTKNGVDPDVIHISGDVYAVAYEGDKDDGWIATFTIDSSGIIGNSVIDSYEFNNSNGETPSIVHVTGNIFAIAYDGPGSDGWVSTLSIDSSGNISNVIDNMEYDTSTGKNQHLIALSSSVFAVAYTGPGNDGWIKTFSIDVSGNIGSVIDSFEFDNSQGEYPYIYNISGNIYSIVYTGSGNDGHIITLTLDSNGNIGSIIDSLEFDTTQGLYPHITNTEGTIYAVSYTGNNNAGYVTIFNITNSGQIDNSVIDSYEFDTTQGNDSQIIYLSNNYLAIAYEGSGSDGWVTTVQLSEAQATYPTDLPTINSNTSLILPTSSIGFWRSFEEIANKDGGQIYYQLSDDDGSSWVYWSGGSWNPATANDYNLATDINTNISSFSTNTGKIMFKAYLQSNGTQYVRLNNVQIGWGEQEGGGAPSGYATYGEIRSSAFNMQNSSPVQTIEWDEDMSSCTPTCDVKLQVRTAPDSGGSPGSWTSWYGSGGASTYFTESQGTLISTDLNNNQWMQYRVELSGDGLSTPIFEELRLNYK